MKATILQILFLLLLAGSASAQPGPPPCGPVVVAPLAATAVATWVAPITDVLGNPLVNAVTQYNIYLDPPGCVVSGPPTAVVVAPMTSWPVPAGQHAIFVTAVNLDGESPPAGPVLFSRSP